MSDAEDETDAPGWDAIDRALKSVYGAQEPKHYGCVLPMSLGGNEPLQGISIYLSNIDRPHWHYVTYGFTELYEKESEDAETSGFGFELTFRLARHDGDSEPPTWPLDFLQNIARYVFRTGNRFDQHHHVTLNGPIALDTATQITAISFVIDPELGTATSPNGQFRFLQVVGLCTDEYELAKEWNCAGLLEYVKKHSLLFVTDLNRPSVLSDLRVAESIRTIAASEGSSQAEVFGMIAEHSVDGKRLNVRLDANIVDDVRKMLRGRIKYGKTFIVYGERSAIVFEASQTATWRIDDEGALVIGINDAVANEILATIEARRGNYRFQSLQNVTFEVVPTEIKDADGNVVRTIG